jgi:integrase
VSGDGPRHAQSHRGHDEAAPRERGWTRTVSDWLDIHWATIQQRGYKAQTLRNRGAKVAHIRRIWGAKIIAELRPFEVSAGLQEFLPKNTSGAGRVLGELRDALSEAVANDWVLTNAAASIKVPKHRVQRKRLKFETWQAMRLLAETSRQRWLLCLLLLAVITGQRRADLAKMQFADVVDGHLRIEQQKESGKGYGARIELPLSLRLDAIGMSLREVIELCRDSGAPGPNLLRKANGGCIELSSLSARFNECIRTVLGDDAHPMYEWPSLHEVRSLSARLYRAEGHDTQTLLGHKDAEMTAVYEDDRGLSAANWKRLVIPATSPTVI